jgi:CheY-like chemotaxis protein
LASSLLSIDLDAGRKASERPQRESTLPEPDRTSSRPGHCPVLIVEDDADLREMMAQLLAIEGYRAQTVPNGLAALDYLRKGDFPEVILLDLMMPVMDGWEFRRRQREDPQLARVPVVVLSALDQSRAADLDGAAFLKKPLDFDRLLQLVRQYCRNSH